MELKMGHFLTLFDLIGVLARRRYQAAEHGFAVLGLNHTEARLLTILRGEGGATPQDELSGRIHVDRTNAGRALQRLEGEGYVVRRKDDADRRMNFVQITPKGRQAAAEIAKLKKKMAESFFGDLTEDEAGLAVKLLRRAVPDEIPALQMTPTGKSRPKR